MKVWTGIKNTLLIRQNNAEGVEQHADNVDEQSPTFPFKHTLDHSHLPCPVTIWRFMLTDFVPVIGISGYFFQKKMF
ncbi:MAG: hypothetical protein HDR30_00490 [Lachnospiraceae bacterium]|nr:hypothetical protein [Lachnospiraceae bacterium]